MPSASSDLGPGWLGRGLMSWLALCAALTWAPSNAASEPSASPAWAPPTPPEALARLAPRSPDGCPGEPELTAFGVGHLAFVEGFPNAFAEWVADVRIPLYAVPDGEPWGWLAHGWIWRPDHPHEEADICGMVETDYETHTYLVDEIRPDGWFRLRFSAPGRGPLGDGTAWTHADTAAGQPRALRVEAWSELFADPERGPFFADLPEGALIYPAPDASVAPLADLGDDHDLEPLEMRGEWLRVRAVVPSVECASDPEVEPVIQEGWVRWWCGKRGPCLWFHTRGC